MLDTGERLPAATVIVGCGVVPNDALARRAGVFCRAGILVDGHGRTDRDWIWAAGDVASMINPHVEAEVGKALLALSGEPVPAGIPLTSPAPSDSRAPEQPCIS